MTTRMSGRTVQANTAQAHRASQAAGLACNCPAPDPQQAMGTVLDQVVDPTAGQAQGQAVGQAAGQAASQAAEWARQPIAAAAVVEGQVAAQVNWAQ